MSYDVHIHRAENSFDAAESPIPEHLLRRMAEIAHDLGARLQGDDGEFYGLDGKPLPED